MVSEVSCAPTSAMMTATDSRDDEVAALQVLVEPDARLDGHGLDLLELIALAAKRVERDIARIAGDDGERITQGDVRRVVVGRIQDGLDGRSSGIVQAFREIRRDDDGDLAVRPVDRSDQSRIGLDVAGNRKIG